ncbi:ABC transporter permease [Gemmatimonadota bacterium]
MNSKPNTPWPVRLVLRLLCNAEEREYLLGDLEERKPSSWLREVAAIISLRFDVQRSSLPDPRKPHQIANGGDNLILQLLQDLRFGLRLMLRNPGFTAVALLTMALGIGANTALFSLVHGVLLSPLPYPEPDRIVVLNESNLSKGWPTFSIAPENFRSWQERSHSFSRMATYRRATATYAGGELPQNRQAYYVADGFLEIMGGELALGRGFSPEEFDPGAQQVVILTHPFWQQSFGSDPDVLGTTVILDDLPHTVVGLLAEEWRPMTASGAHVFIPLRPRDWWLGNRTTHMLKGVARLSPGVTPEQAQADLSAIATSLESEYPESNEGWGAVVTPLHETVTGNVRAQLLILLAAVGLVLLIACANVSNMMLARTSSRSHELNIRTAIGAGRGRVVRQLLVESLLLFLVGGALGLLLAYVALDFFVDQWAFLLPRSDTIHLNAPVLLFTTGISLAAGLLAGLFPAFATRGANLAGSLQQSTRSIAGAAARRWVRGGLVVGEVALAVVLLIGSGLLVRSLAALQEVNPGFELENRLFFTARLPISKYETAGSQVAFADQVLARLEAIPGVETAAVSTMVPLGGGETWWGITFEGRPAASSADAPDALYTRSSHAYFESMGIPLRAGRFFTPADREGDVPVAVVSESFARLHYPDGTPLGNRIRVSGPNADWLEIVGVVGDVKQWRWEQGPEAQMYEPFLQRPSNLMTFIARTSAPPHSLIEVVRSEVQEVDPNQPLVSFASMEDRVERLLSLPRFRTLLFTCFGMVALLLSVVGLYGVLSYTVSNRTREIGVRIAVGAERRSVLGLVLRDGIRLVVTGLVLGVGGALALTRLLETLLFGVGMRDPWIFASVPLLLMGVATMAMLIPARRATRVDPVEALRQE